MKSTSIRNHVHAAFAGHWIKALVVASIAAMAMTACGSSGGGSSTPGVVVNPDGSIVGGNCPAGQIYSPTSGCVTSTAYSSGRYTGQMNSINQSAFANVLKLMGACDQYSLINIGLSSCSAYSSRAFMVLNVSGNYAQGVLYAGASSIYTTSGAMIPISFSGNLNPINNSTAFVIQNSSGMQLYIDAATISGNSIPAHITYQGGTIGSLTLTSY